MAYNINNIHTNDTNPQEKPVKKLYLSSLPSGVRETELSNLFGKYGKVHTINLSMDPRNGFCRGFGSISFSSRISLSEILKNDHKIMGRSIMCEPFIERESDLELRKILNSRRRVFVSNIPSWMTNQNLRNFFSQYGTVVSAYRIEQHHSMKKMPFGYIYFEDISSAEKCLEDGFKFMGIRYGFMLFDKYTKDKKERHRMRKIRDKKIRNFKESTRHIDFSHFENDHSYRYQQSSKIRNPNSRGDIETPKAVKTQDQNDRNQYRNQSLLQNLSSYRDDQKLGRIQEIMDDTKKEIYLNIFKKRNNLSKSEMRLKRIRQAEFHLFEPTSSKYWTVSLKRSQYFELWNEDNYRLNVIPKL